MFGNIFFKNIYYYSITLFSNITLNAFICVKKNILNLSCTLYKIFISTYNECVERNKDIENHNDIEDDYNKIDKKYSFNNNDIKIYNSSENKNLLDDSNSIQRNNPLINNNRYDNYLETDLKYIEPEVFFNIGQSMMKYDNSIIYRNP